MQFQRCPSPDCGRPFQVNQYKPRGSHSFVPGKITCPHCGMQIDADRKSVFLTHALSASEEEDFNTAHGKRDRARDHAGDGNASGHAHSHRADDRGGHADRHNADRVGHRFGNSGPSSGSHSQ